MGLRPPKNELWALDDSTNANSLKIVVKPGNPPYLKYVRSTVEEKRQEYKKQTGSDPLHLPDRTKYTYKTGEKDQVLESDVHGNPNLVYDSKFNEGWEPSGVPVLHPLLRN